MARTSEKQKIDNSTKILTDRDYQVIPPNKITCLYHEEETNILGIGNFYNANKVSIFRNSAGGKIPICKKCIKDIYTNYYTSSQDAKWSLYKICQKLDIPFFNSIYEGAMKESYDNWQKVLGNYMKTYNSLGAENNWEYNFDSSDEVTDTSDDIEERKDAEKDRDRLVKSEKDAKKDILKMLDHDPFVDFSISDQKYVYKNLLEYLKDEDILEDSHKVSQIMQIVVNNNQIRIYSNEISRLLVDPMKNLDSLKGINTLLKDIVKNNNEMAKENGISEKNRKNQKAGGNTLGVQMKVMRQMDFEKAEHDYYSMKKAYGLRQAFDISNQAILEQLNFDEKDVSDLIQYQRTLIKELQDKILEVEEDLRKAFSGEKNE